ncbi:SDR family oxidoreductase [Nodosilinea sp. E11]|uniref:SDR family oxidoreductase n=1 Tax=Nodosilinea sp. E11 TaxID=3037479 RepID=UPI002934EB00|nr:SDR family oxidoreductase [Nodosilinea sp. E11]WOD37246.1 SDR family oxidoreductase [Nodosilinea sp. E11]
MDLAIQRRVALVIGASSGIGEATAKLLLKEGCFVVACSRSLSNLERAYSDSLEALREGKIFLFECDIGEEEQCRRLVKEVIAKFDRIDILINSSAGPSFAWGLEQVPGENWETVFTGKLFGYIRMIQLVIPIMERNNWGRIVSLAGIAAKEPSLPLIQAGAVNAALINLSKSISQYTSSKNVLINTVSPGIIKTARFRSFLNGYASQLKQDNDVVENLLIQKVPTKRLGTVDEVANLIAFLASDCSSYITGTNISIDGGLSTTAF